LVVPRHARWSGKALVLLSLLIGLGLAALVTMSRGRQLSMQHSTGYPWPSVLSPEPAMTMASQFVQPARAQLRQPTSGMAKLGGAQAKYGIGSSPLQNLAITAIQHASSCQCVGCAGKKRDISVMASMDSRTKAMVANVGKDVTAKARSLAGVTAPMDYFDPLGFSADVSEGKLLFYREAELKHGRVCMLASLGILVGEQFHPLFGGNIDVPSYVAFQQTPLETFWPAVVAAIAIPEIFSVFTFNPPDDGGSGFEWWTVRSDREAGDLGFDPLGLKPTNAEEFKEMQTKELNNGRLAMIAAAGMIAQELASGQKLFGN